MPEVFISYSQQDKIVADAACAVLEQEGIACWIAPRDIAAGEEWGDAIIRGIDSCLFVVFIFSRSSNESPWVKRELERAVSRGMPIVPFRIENVQPLGGMELFASASHWLDAFTPPLELHLRKLAGTVGLWLQEGRPPSASQSTRRSLSRVVAPKRDASNSARRIALIAAALAVAAFGVWLVKSDRQPVQASPSASAPQSAVTNPPAKPQPSPPPIAIKPPPETKPPPSSAPIASSMSATAPPPSPNASGSAAADPLDGILKRDAFIAQLEAGFATALEREAEASYQAALKTLNAQYLAALDRSRETARVAGDAEEMAALDLERKSVLSAQVPDVDAAGRPSIMPLRATYLATLAKAQTARQQTILGLYLKYENAVAEHEKGLARSNKISEALDAKKWRENISAARAALETSPRSQDSQQPAAPQSGSTVADKDGFVPLFDGGFLKGWKEDAPGYRIVGGILISPDGYADLISEREYADFHLKFDLKLSSGANNGIGFWCDDRKGAYRSLLATGYEVQLIDDSKPSYTEGDAWHLHGALSYFSAPSSKPLKPTGSWNEHEIIVRWPRIEVLVNGIKVLDEDFTKLVLKTDRSRGPANLAKRAGHLVFSGMKGPVEFKNLRIKELSRATSLPAPVQRLPASAPQVSIPAADKDGFAPMFDGVTLNGWKGATVGYRMAGGILTSPDGEGDLITEKKYSSFHLKFDLKLSSGSNNGIGVWCDDDKGTNRFLVHTGFEIALIDDKAQEYRRLEKWQKHGSLTYFEEPSSHPMNAPGTWNQHEIIVQGSRLQVIINGKKVIDEDLARVRPQTTNRKPLNPNRRSGHLVLTGMRGPVEFRNMRIKEL